MKETEGRQKNIHIITLIFFVIMLGWLGLVVFGKNSNDPQQPVITKEIHNIETMTQVKIETNKGDIVVGLYEDDAPKTTENFLKLVGEGYYDGIIFHRVIKDFMIQGGDPTGTGSGGPGYTFEDELDPATDSAKEGYKRGVLAMANAGPNTNGSQFFIMHQDYPLPHSYTIFGKVVSGIETVDTIAESETGAQDRPAEEVVMKKVSVVK